MTRGLEGRRSVQLSYGRGNGPALSVGALGFEPRTSCSQSRRATELRHAPSRAENDSGAGVRGQVSKALSEYGNGA
jgi:hypothetical protein